MTADGPNAPAGALEWLPTDASGQPLPRCEVRFRPHGRTYAFAWGGEGELVVGDLVAAPRPPEWVGPHIEWAVVARLGSRYEGPVRTITRKYKFCD